MLGAVNGIKFHIEKLNKMLLEDEPNFEVKKKMTSLIRRIAPIGVKTNIMFTGNARALRHIIQQRTSMHAEVEIREAFLGVALKCREYAPNIFQDMVVTQGGVTFENEKV